MNKRDHYIDFIRGIALIGVVFIHTTFWSGMSYVPELLRNISLILDVPLFFFVSGAGLKYSNLNMNIFIKQYSKISFTFFIVIFIIQLFSLNLNYQNLINILCLINAKIDFLPVLDGSFWFVPVYITSLLFTLIIFNLFPKFINVIAVSIFLYFVFKYYTSFNLTSNFFGTDLNYTLFYSLFMLLGYISYNAKKIFFIFILFISLIFIFLNAYYSIDNFIMQNYKFPPSIIYFFYSLISISFFMIIKNKKIRNKLIEYLGRNAIYFYISQCISSSIIMYIQEYVKNQWYIKLFLLFTLNMIIFIFCGQLLIYFFNKLFYPFIRKISIYKNKFFITNL